MALLLFVHCLSSAAAPDADMIQKKVHSMSMQLSDIFVFNLGIS
jgi:hypothetical protein